MGKLGPSDWPAAITQQLETLWGLDAEITAVHLDVASGRVEIHTTPQIERKSA